jgi:hypothetical protein
MPNELKDMGKSAVQGLGGGGANQGDVDALNKSYVDLLAKYNKMQPMVDDIQTRQNSYQTPYWE